MTHIEWKESVPNVGPSTTYGYWEDAKVFSIHAEITNRAPHTRYVLKSNLPGFRPDLPMQPSIAEAQVFAERMLQRWVAKRGLLFKTHIIVTDAMVAAARNVQHLEDETLRRLIQAAIEAREPHAPSITKISRRN